MVVCVLLCRRVHLLSRKDHMVSKIRRNLPKTGNIELHLAYTVDFDRLCHPCKPLACDQAAPGYPRSEDWIVHEFSIRWLVSF